MTGLFEQFISTDNLILAFKRIAAKKAGGGIVKGSSRRL